ncbi:GDSL esterase/lipase At5g55050-like [Oryza glaberrima]|uniref:GDSL esterase/lipase At5g55050-like n=1 Tax=Oryza glaberrima TaxID=4538 RepID=UPI00224BF54B|nr:GDSL esterase/lipase At5g55050-like [Oryza glaberrima]
MGCHRPAATAGGRAALPSLSFFLRRPLRLHFSFPTSPAAVASLSFQAARGDDASSVFLQTPSVAGVLSLVIIASFQVLGSAEGHKTAVPAIFVFGDGMLDVGNNNYLPSDAPQADYPYYGIDFPGSEPTGRFSNGYNMADFIAKDMGFKMSPPAYLSLNSSIKMETNFTGVNYASAGAGIQIIMNDEATIPFVYQVKNFNDTVSQMEANLGHQKLSKLLAKSLFLISIGTMDLSVNIWRVLRYSRKPSPFNIPYTLSSYKAIIMQLYGLGARKFGIINIQPLGCQPWMRKNLENNVDCNDSMNSLAREFNDGLKPLFSNLSSQLSGLSYSIADFYAFSNATFMNPRAYGFVNINSTCCIPPCTPEHEPPCQNRKQYWFWDLSYTTERAAKLAASAFYDGPARFTAPVNFKRLIKMK